MPTEVKEDKPLVNRVAQSGLITLNLEDFLPSEEIVSFDLKDFLFRELILREKDFREALKQHDWSIYQDKALAVFCSTDAIIPLWAYMLVTTYAQPYCVSIFQGTPTEMEKVRVSEALAKIDPTTYQDKRVVIKGCSDREVPAQAYLEITRILLPHTKSLMYGEPCSTVPIYKKLRV